VCLRTSNIQEQLDESDLLAVPFSLVKSPEKHVRVGDVLVSSANSWNLVGKCCRVTSLRFESTAGGFISILRPTTDRLDPGYLYRWFSWDRTQETVRSFGRQTTNISNLDHKRTLLLPIPLPPLREQKRIVAILDAAEVLRAKRQKSIDQLDSLVQATFWEMFGDPVTNDHRWDLVSLGEHASKVGSGATPKGGDAAYKREGITLIRSQNVHDGDFRLEGLAFIDTAQATKLANVEVAENDVLLNITGASVARVCRAPRYVLPARVNQHVCIIRTKPTLNAYFLEKLLMSPSMKRTLLGIGEAGATRQAITKSEVLRLALPLPPVELQARFASFVRLVESQKDRLNRHLAQLEMLFVSLQSRAFSGELCSSSFSRQPASA
jgi:type I restriction enzyme S subunit